MFSILSHESSPFLSSIVHSFFSVPLSWPEGVRQYNCDSFTLPRKSRYHGQHQPTVSAGIAAPAAVRPPAAACWPASCFGSPLLTDILQASFLLPELPPSAFPGTALPVLYSPASVLLLRSRLLPPRQSSHRCQPHSHSFESPMLYRGTSYCEEVSLPLTFPSFVTTRNVFHTPPFCPGQRPFPYRPEARH